MTANEISRRTAAYDHAIERDASGVTFHWPRSDMSIVYPVLRDTLAGIIGIEASMFVVRQDEITLHVPAEIA